MVAELQNLEQQKIMESTGNDLLHNGDNKVEIMYVGESISYTTETTRLKKGTTPKYNY